MKKLMLPLFAALLFAACQHSTTTTPPSDAQNAPTEIKIDPAQVKEANTKAQTSLQNMNNLMKDIDAAVATSNEAQKADIETIRGHLNDLLTKEETMAKGLEAAAASGPATPPPGVLQDYIQSASNYDKLIEDMKVELEAAKNGTSKKKQ